ncbi:MAG: tRNA threonylcarbamoyladenosine biosynthesis protein TsaE [Glaciecola sp.]|jgi:tRNA threonylcarbamoyladenosine biosynthesis protein TsaE
MNKNKFVAHSEDDTKSIAQKMAATLKQTGLGGITVYLNGDLGAGKTTFTRHLIQALGHVGSVKSPTYALVEPYEIDDIKLFHFDLYRLADAEELEFMGIRDYFSKNSMCLIEWAEKGWGLLAKPDIELDIKIDGESGQGDESRQFEFLAKSEAGECIISSMKEA